jgi:hypothetical protein
MVFLCQKFKGGATLKEEKLHYFISSQTGPMFYSDNRNISPPHPQNDEYIMVLSSNKFPGKIKIWWWIKIYKKILLSRIKTMTFDLEIYDNLCK